ncbi:MAG: aminoacyl-histidine dipeptidase [Butyrivibrio sp.]|nr:aminoacyl-histidine dipeptidase [Butyrivibrio sp.]
MALETLQPVEVFHYFEELCGIPHGSGNLKKISDYLVSFAGERGLEVIQDEELNVIIKAPGTLGLADREPVILQGHMDMVAVKEDGADIDMNHDGLKVRTDGKEIWAEGTSLGGDDGIAVAYCLALLDSKDIPHPPLEVVITTNEETGMFGASAIDLSMLKGKRLINIDNEEEGVFIVSCAGGARFYSELPIKREKRTGTRVRVNVSGLLGGHSGEMIKKGRGNACIILARILLEAKAGISFDLTSIFGGVADNAIPGTASAEVLLDDGDVCAFREAVTSSAKEIRGELEGKDEGLVADVSEVEASECMAICRDDTLKVLSLICAMPDGVQAMSATVEGLVETSLNMGILKTSTDFITIEQSVRSSVSSSKEYLLRKLEIIAKGFGAKTAVSGSYPGWKYNPDSALREHMVKVYEDMYGIKPTVEAIHAGLECGILSEKIPGLDCISIGPDMQDIHSTKERLSVQSAANVWNYLKEVLSSM